MLPFPVVIALSRESNCSRSNSYAEHYPIKKIIAQYDHEPHSVNEIQEQFDNIESLEASSFKKSQDIIQARGIGTQTSSSNL